MTHFETWLDFTNQFFGILKHVWFSVQKREDLETFQSMCLWQNKLIDYVIFNFRWCHFGLWFVNYTPVVWPSQWCHQSSSFHKRYPWSKFQVHTIPRSWDTRGCTPPPSCTVTKVEKGCTVERLIYESRHCEHECVFVGLFFVKEHFVCLPPLNRCHF